MRRYPRGVFVAFGIGVLALVGVFTLLTPRVEPAAEPRVELLTGGPGFTRISSTLVSVSCHTNSTSGELMVDPSAGTVLMGVGPGEVYPTVAVIWPLGFTGRRTPDGQVEVLDQTGSVVARTGTQITLLGGYDQSTNGSSGWQACYGGISLDPPLR